MCPLQAREAFVNIESRGSIDWEILFDFYDNREDVSSPALVYSNFNRMVRLDVNLNEQHISDHQLETLFGHIDHNGDGDISLNEWMDW